MHHLHGGSLHRERSTATPKEGTADASMYVIHKRLLPSADECGRWNIKERLGTQMAVATAPKNRSYIIAMLADRSESVHNTNGFAE